MTSQPTIGRFGARVLRWVRRHATPDGRILQQRLDKIAAEARAADGVAGQIVCASAIQCRQPEGSDHACTHA